VLTFQYVLGKGDGKAKVKNRDLFMVVWDAVDEYHVRAGSDAAWSSYVGVVDEITANKTEGDKTEARAADPRPEENFVEGIEEALTRSLKVDSYLNLSGTPFRALTEGELLEDQV
jgi:hypothetical protein